MRIFSALIVALLLFSRGIAGSPNEEFRATWVITWHLIDAGKSAEANKALARQILDNHQKANMNAVLWQVRQSGTAYYNSAYEPWGYYAGYKDPGYDPLAYAVEEAHKRGMELHAWFNVFAASATIPGAPAAENPDWICRDRDGYPMTANIALSPGLAEVREYTINVAMEIVRNYDIDGLHLDYVRWNEYTNSLLSKTLTKELPREHFQLDGMITPKQIEELNTNLAGRYLYDYQHPYSAGVPGGFASWEEWWRWSVTEFVRVLHDSIQSVKPWVRLSVAALGNYNWGGWQGYGSVYQDAALWFNQGFIEQLTPMHYHWLTASGFYDMLAGNPSASWQPWIQPGIQDRRLYSVGPGSYRFAENNVWGRHPSVVAACRTIPWVDGFQFFSYGSWDAYNYWENAALLFFNRKTKVRSIDQINLFLPDAPELALEKIDSLNYQITVSPPDTISTEHWFAVYRSTDEVFDADTDEIIHIQFDKADFQLIDQFSGTQDYNGKFYYFASMLNRYWVESPGSVFGQTDSIPSFAPIVVATTPAEGDTIEVTDDIIVQFSKTIDASTFPDAISFNPAVSVADFSWSLDQKTVTIQIDGSFEYATDYTLTVSASLTDINGKPLDGNKDGFAGDDFVLHFSTYLFDVFGPVVTSSYPYHDSFTDDFPIDGVMTVVFDEIIDINTINETTVKFFDDSGLIPVEYHVTNLKERSILSVQTVEPLYNTTNYTLSLSSDISDLLGNKMDEDVSIYFTTSSQAYDEMIIIDQFLSVSNWQQPSWSGSTTGIIVPNTIFDMSAEAYLPSSSTRQRNSARLRYEWDTTADEFLLREYASGSAIQSTRFDTSYTLQCYLFGDGSMNKFRFSLREVEGEGYPLEVSKWLTIDWYGWRIVEWKLSDPNSVGTWLGNEIMDGKSYYVDSFQLTYEEGADISGKIFFDNLRLVKKVTTSAVLALNDVTIAPTQFELYQNYPNPFNPTSMISFYVPHRNPVQLTVYDILGRKIAIIVNEALEKGYHQVQFDGTELPSGIYIYQIRYDNQTFARQMLLMK
ncbi:MAG TPA: T9SS type A sorting domain-containing protein [bacterium]|nr:T9SS type A sorting domain-containing protein [bacterium]